MDSTNSRLDAITKEVQELNSSIQFTQNNIDELNTIRAKQSEHCNTAQTGVMKLCKSLQVLMNKQEEKQHRDWWNTRSPRWILSRFRGESETSSKGEAMAKRSRWIMHTAQVNLWLTEIDHDPLLSSSCVSRRKLRSGKEPKTSRALKYLSVRTTQTLYI